MVTRDIIDELYDGNLGASHLAIKKDSEYRKKYTEINSLVESMNSAPTKENLEKLDDAIGDLDGIISRAFFTLGFRIGARMVLSIMRDDHDTFSFR